jgi:virulence-associated protein VapD
MSQSLLLEQETLVEEDDSEPIGWPQEPMYAIAFDLDTTTLKAHYGSSHENAYGEIRKVLESRGFILRQRSVYYGDENVDQVACVLAIQDLSKRFSWFKPSLNDIRMLKLVPNDDLKRVL